VRPAKLAHQNDLPPQEARVEHSQSGRPIRCRFEVITVAAFEVITEDVSSFRQAMLWELLNVETKPQDLVEVKVSASARNVPVFFGKKVLGKCSNALVQPFEPIVLNWTVFRFANNEILVCAGRNFRFQAMVVWFNDSGWKAPTN